MAKEENTLLEVVLDVMAALFCQLPAKLTRIFYRFHVIFLARKVVLLKLSAGLNGAPVRVLVVLERGAGRSYLVSYFHQ